MLQEIQDFIVTFSSILWEAMPFIVLGAIIAGILEELLPQQLIGRIMPRHALPAVMIGGLLGLIFPMCECGIVVVMRRLLRKGLPLSCCVSYMLAGPIVNVIVLLSTYVAFGGLDDRSRDIAVEVVLIRAGMGFLVACGAGLVVFMLEQRTGTASLLKGIAVPPPKGGVSLTVVENNDVKPEPRKSVFKRLSNISETALHDFMDITVFLILGAILAALAKLMIGPELISSISRDQPYLAIPAMMLLAVVMCLCSEADAFVAASFTEMTISAKMSFLVLGPMLDLKLLMMYTRVFRGKLIATIVTCTVIQVAVYSAILHVAYTPPQFRDTPSLAAPANNPNPTPATVTK